MFWPVLLIVCVDATYNDALALDSLHGVREECKQFFADEESLKKEYSLAVVLKHSKDKELTALKNEWKNALKHEKKQRGTLFQRLTTPGKCDYPHQLNSDMFIPALHFSTRAKALVDQSELLVKTDLPENLNDFIQGYADFAEPEFWARYQ